MSSIYKKGRDGYYYYQVYVFNQETGKKDKRIFYSLGTKSKDEALAKKIVLDDSLKNKKNWKQIFLILLSVLSLFAILNNYTFKNKKQLLDRVENGNEYHIEDHKIKNDSSFSSLINLNSNTISYGKKEDAAVEEDTSTEKDISLGQGINFKTIKIEKIKGGFNQLKLFILVPEDSNSDMIRITCEKIKKNHSEFKSIIICVFSDTKKGIDLAQGKDFNKNTYSYKESWLAMYSYNPIEGQYFDNNPNGYRGILK